MKRFYPTAATAIAALLLSINPAFARSAASPPLYTPHRITSVMTYNVYLGADVTPLLAASSEAELIAAVGTAWAQVVASNIPERAASIAQEIADNEPALVGLQEVAQWSLGPTPASLTVQYDFLKLILDSLEADGADYVPVVVKDNIDATAPMVDPSTGSLVYVRLIDRDAILARGDLPAADLKLSNMQEKTFTNLLSFASPVFGMVTIPRSWLSVDAKVRGKSFRFITTHLEPYNPLIPYSLTVQEAQAAELLAGPANTKLPVVLAGDFNSDANGIGPDATPTYNDLIDAGFQDTWATLHPALSGDTCCQDPDLANMTSDLYERIDLVLTRSAMGDSAAQIVGDETIASSPPLWASEHAALTAILNVPTHIKFANR